MENKSYKSRIGGDLGMAVNDKIEIISNSIPEIYGAVGRILEISETDTGTDIRVETDNGLDIWIDAEDAVIY